MKTSSVVRLLTLPALAAPGLAQGSGPGVTFSIDYGGPTISVPDSGTATPITEGDVLFAREPAGLGTPVYGPLPTPSIFQSGTSLGLALHAGCVGHLPGTPCGVEVDALSYGLDGFLVNVNYDDKGKIYFSVDRCTAGIAGQPNFPSVASEGSLASREAGPDAFLSLRVPLAGWPLGAGFFIGNTGAIDGNGLVSAPTVLPSGASYPGLGLLEPFPFPAPGGPFDELDALDTEGSIVPGPNGFPSSGIFFSLDGGTAFMDPCDLQFSLPSSGSAVNHGFVSGDVLLTRAAGGPPIVYAPANLLGLDLVNGPDSDDLDALAIVETGDLLWQPSQVPFDWAAGNTDMVLFSVRRGSAVIGMPDSATGTPIEPGDILSTPIPTALGGVSPFPSIIVPAEILGLGTTRSGFQGQFADELDALDIRRDEPVLITHGACYGNFGQCPCGNDDPTAGCANSTGSGGLLLPTAGTSSVALDDLVLTATGLPPNNQGLFYMGDTIVKNVFFDGIQCALGTTFRFLGSIQNTGAVGTMVLGPGTAAASGGLILPGTTWYFQAWHRDSNVPSPCNLNANLTNAIGVCFIP